MSENNAAPADSNEPFQAADWIERLAATLASFLSDSRLRYTYGVQPNVVQGELSLIVAPWLETHDRPTYDYVLAFAQDHQLRIVEDRRTGDRALPRPN